MPKKRRIVSVDDKCRVCLCDEGCMSDIFSEDLRPKINDLGKSTSIPIEDDRSFPRNICHVCLYKLDMWIDFKKQFVRSNTMLQEHLELGKLLDKKASLAKRKHSELEVCAKDNSIEQGDAKKLKSDKPTLISVDCISSKLKTAKQSESNEKPVAVEDSQKLKTVKQSDLNDKPVAIEDSQKLKTVKQSDLNDKPVVIEDSQKKAPDNVKPAEAKEVSGIMSDVIPLASTVSPKVKQIVVRRAKTTERRKESTKRWVARKKALLAATGENDTDTDSMVSDEDQMSPVQKARAKCNAEKVAETHRRMTKALQNVDSNISGYYGTNADSDSCIIQDSDSEVRKDKTNCMIKKPEMPKDGGGDARLPSNNVAISSHPNKSIVENSKKSSNVTNNFLSQSVRSELIVDGATFVVTSTLVLSDPHYLNPVQPKNLSLPTDEANQERNTDIIDAVQLRRVNPKNFKLKNENKLVDTCLNIEVEGTELEALQRVQSELANFVEKDMKNKLTNNDTQTHAAKVDAKAKDAFQTLDQQLKTIVEKTIKKNLENSKITDNRGNNTFTGEFLEAALRSKIFQPRVLIVRHDPNRPNSLSQKSKKRKPIDPPHVEKIATKASNKKIEELLAPLGKRRSVQPVKYADYNTSPFHSEAEEVTVDEVVKKPPAGPKSSKFKTYGPALIKLGQTPVVNQQKVQQPSVLPPKPTINQKSNSTTEIPTPVANNSTGEKHICGICGDSFGTRREVEIHFGTHNKQVKQKMMRCKRCHEIVEARYVKLHVCSVSKNVHKCRSCVATFRSEQLLAKHEESHELEKEPKVDKTSGNEASKSAQEIPDSSQKIASSNEKKDSQTVDQNRVSYTCFVCDKTFTDEEILKDHLQQHCDDMSEDEQSDEKEYQCAICGKSLDSEDALETHVEKHLFDDEDDNPNLISIGVGDNDKSVKKEMLHSCAQCAENFDSEMLLMLHMQAHEEEMAIAEWERRGIDTSQEEQHICVICDDLFANEDDLSEHLDVHNGNAHICLLCDKPFLTLEELQSHVNTH